MSNQLDHNTIEMAHSLRNHSFYFLSHPSMSNDTCDFSSELIVPLQEE